MTNNSATSQNDRPNLSFLQSAWGDSDYYQQEAPFKDANLFNVALPPQEIKDTVVKEIEQMIFVAKTLCLIGSICGTFFMEPLIYPFTLLWAIIWFCRPFLNWMQPLSIITALLLYSTLQSSIFTFPLIAFTLFCFAERFYQANDQLKQNMESEYNHFHDIVNNATTEFREHQSAFLTTVSQEIQDVALMVITTLEQFSPASILSNTHELLSACSLAVPISSISAIHTTIRQICHISSHLQLLSRFTVQTRSLMEESNSTLPQPLHAEFDIGELLQNVGDALAGVAAKIDVNLVIYHCDSSLHHSIVIGNEGAIRHTLFNHLRNILECCTPGACIEVGLNVTPVMDDPNKVSITFYIIHTSSPAIRNIKSIIPNANLTAQLLSFINATSTVKTNKDQTRFKFTFELECGNERQRLFIKDNLLSNYYANIKFSNEPSLKELDHFITKLKGIKMVLHAPEKSIFAKHLTSCLTSWNTDISHVPVLSSHAFEVPTTPTEQKVLQTPSPQVPSPAIEEEHIHSIPPAFILIDNDIHTLQQKLSEFRSQPAASANVLQAHFGGRRKQTKTPSGVYQNFFHQGTTAIIHFTSLANYKAVRDSIQAFASSPERDPFSMPRVVVVPKPAGPRRFLTALHTAFNNSVVEPHFLAIATAPASPISPMVSMLIQRELAIQNTSPNETSPGRRRPLSGIFSPPSEGGTHYFSTHTSPVQSSPRRRADGEGADYITAKATEVVEPEPEPVQEKPEEKTETLVRSVSNVKLRKKKRGKNAFANSVSPPINVLIVEDNIINQAILSTWMKKHKIKFSVASDGLEAVRKWESGGFHLVLMDIQLPGMNGIEATRKIRGIEKEQKIGVLPLQGEPIQKDDDDNTAFQSPVIIVALTASSLESDRHAALAAGCNDFLTKPVSLEWLEKKIIEWGCMQALIDFEGWRRWKQTSEYQPKKEEKPVTPVKQDQVEIKEPKPKNSKGILLHGVGNLTRPKKAEKSKKTKSDKMEEL
ncbi:hypothetical protein K501DRAFT_254298 [Backusella circina FSU 941]|nr:hypothetical protein K501DRAFT_254298 [Backusella circina FSU 941]